jgi:hypothetical protein
MFVYPTLASVSHLLLLPECDVFDRLAGPAILAVFYFYKVNRAGTPDPAAAALRHNVDLAPPCLPVALQYLEPMPFEPGYRLTLRPLSDSRSIPSHPTIIPFQVKHQKNVNKWADREIYLHNTGVGFEGLETHAMDET